jgi:hypothetical protein
MSNFAGVVTLPSGITATYHRLMRVELDAQGEQAIVDIHSWGSELAQEQGYAPEAQRVGMPFSALAGAAALVDAVRAALVDDGGALAGTALLAEGGGLAAAKARQAALIAAERNARELGTFEWDGDEWLGDAASQRRVIGFATDALVATAQSAAFSATWTLADGSTRTLDAAQQMALARALMAHVAELHARERALLALIDEAEAPEAAQAIEWDSELP